MLDPFTKDSLAQNEALNQRLDELAPLCPVCGERMTVISWAPYRNSSTLPAFAYTCPEAEKRDSPGGVHQIYLIYWMDIERLLDTPLGSRPTDWWPEKPRQKCKRA